METALKTKKERISSIAVRGSLKTGSRDIKSCIHRKNNNKRKKKELHSDSVDWKTNAKEFKLKQNASQTAGSPREQKQSETVAC